MTDKYRELQAKEAQQESMKTKKECIVNWEMITSNCGDYTERLKVPNGWIVKNTMHYCESVTQTMVFVSDPKHDWSNIK